MVDRPAWPAASLQSDNSGVQGYLNKRRLSRALLRGNCHLRQVRRSEMRRDSTVNRNRWSRRTHLSKEGWADAKAQFFRDSPVKPAESEHWWLER
jgi:hypothetical protein